MKIYEGRLPEDLLPIANDEGGNLICIGLEGERLDQIFFWDHEEEADPRQGQVPSYNNICFVADWFWEFFNSLHELDE